MYEDSDLLDAEAVGEEQAEANAQFIVKACNNFDPLIDVLDRITTLHHYQETDGPKPTMSNGRHCLKKPKNY